MANQPPAQQLFHLSLNEDAKTTVVLLHGLMSSHLEYDFVTPHLSDYHLLVVDLPQHSGSAHIKPFLLPSAASYVSALIEQHAHSRKAHIVGLSAGGFVAQELAKQRPELVLSLWVTGSSPLAGWGKWLAEHPGWLSPMMMGMVKYSPQWMNKASIKWQGLRWHKTLMDELNANCSPELLRVAYGSILEQTYEDIKVISARTLAVAGGKQDDVEGMKKMGRALRESCGDSKAAVVKGAVHAWDLQFPELFAAGVKAWIEGKELPKEFQELS